MFFSKKRFPSAEAIEQEDKQKVKLYQEFVETQNSDDLKEYFELHDEVNGPTFKKEKEKVTKLSYKKTEDFVKEKEFHKLSKNRSLKRYFETASSSVLKDYLDFKESESYSDIQDKAKRKESVKLKNYYKFENSKAYRNYKEIHNSPILKRNGELKDYLSTEEHKNYKSYCLDSKRWEKTEHFRKEQRFKELSANTAISNFLKYKDTNYFDDQKFWELNFSDEYSNGKLDSDKWIPSLLWVKKMGNDLYSSENEFQAYNGSKNISVSNNKMTLKTRKEKGEGKFWDAQKGFVVRETPYTSAIISCVNKLDAKEGMIKLKVKLSGNGAVDHSAWLSTEKNNQSVILFKAKGKRLLQGVLTKNKTGVHKSVEVAKKVSLQNKFHILTLEWNEKTIIWKVNGVAVNTTANKLNKAPMHLIINSTVANPKKAGDAEMTIDWVRSYSKKATVK